MAKPIDSIGPRPDKKQAKPVVEHKAGQVVRPKGAAPKAGETTTPEGYIPPEEKARANVLSPSAKREYQSMRWRTIFGEKGSRKQKTIYGSAIIVVSLALVIGVFFWRQNQNSMLNGVQKKSVTDQETIQQADQSFAQLPGVENLTDQQKQQLNNSLGPSYKAAYVTGLAPTDEEMKLANFAFGNSASPEQIQKYTQSIIDRKLELVKTTGYYEAYAYYLWFGNTIVNKLPEEQIPGWGDAAVLASDKEYASQKAAEYRDQLTKGSISSSDLVGALNSDMRLKLYDETNGSTFFTNATSGIALEDDGRYESVQSVLYRQNTPGITGIEKIVADPGFPASGTKREVGLFFLQVTKVLKGQAVVDYYEEQLNLAKGSAQ